MGVGFEKQDYLLYFRKVKLPQGCSRTLLSDIQCLTITYRGLKDDLTFDVVSEVSGTPVRLRCSHNFSFCGWGISVQKTMGSRKFYIVV